MSLLTQLLHVFLGAPLSSTPITFILVHFFTQLFSSFRSTCPNHLNLPLCILFSTHSMPKRFKSSSLRFLSFKDTFIDDKKKKKKIQSFRLARFMGYSNRVQIIWASETWFNWLYLDFSPNFYWKARWVCDCRPLQTGHSKPVHPADWGTPTDWASSPLQTWAPRASLTCGFECFVINIMYMYVLASGKFITC